MLWPLEAWYMDIPIVTRLFITGAVATSVAVQCNWVTPFQLFFSWHSVIIRKQVSYFLLSKKNIFNKIVLEINYNISLFRKFKF